MPWKEQVLMRFHVEMYEILDLLYLYWYKVFEVPSMEHLHMSVLETSLPMDRSHGPLVSDIFA